MCFRFGVGYGGGPSLDPLGGRPGSEYGSTEGGLTIGAFAEGGGEMLSRFLGIGGKLKLEGGLQLGGRGGRPGCRKGNWASGYRQLAPQSSVGKPTPVKPAVAAGLEACIFGAAKGTKPTSSSAASRGAPAPCDCQ